MLNQKEDGDTQELEAQRHRLIQDAKANSRGSQHNVNELNRVIEENEGVEEIFHSKYQPPAPSGRVRQPVHMAFEEDDLELHTVVATRAISAEIPGVSQNAMRLRSFPLSLSGEITNWLNELPHNSMRTWPELREVFMERFFHEAEELKMKDEIGSPKQLQSEAMHDTWWRFNQNLKKCPNHGLTYSNLIQIMVVMDEVSKNNRAWHITNAEVGELGFTFELSAEQRKREEEWDQYMAHIKTQMDILTKHLISVLENVNLVGATKKYKEQDADFMWRPSISTTRGIS
ncbi:hypothetical protein KY290_010754 [Solanum tuberosum]|uniref:Retrotransposon gag domain-containing protein n=1 Tax=Solanum tuberosum TaxID=4113 RepID=A0ABQ7VYP0_SOLTU|nr:hypothetical protein KY290_010754 [Solanum tuberosum]